MSERTFYERVEKRGGFKFIRLKSGRMITFSEAHGFAKAAESALATAVSRMFKLAGPTSGDPELTDWDLERIEWFIDEVASYLTAVRTEIEKRRGVKSQEERIALLRNVGGRSPEEAAAFTRKADELERRLREVSR